MSKNSIAVAFVTFLVFSAIGLSAGYMYGTKDIVLSTAIRDGERVCSSGENTDCKYLEFFEGEVFQNKDSFFHLKFNSSDIHSKIHKGSTCVMEVYGIRVPFLSMYRNIVDIACEPAGFEWDDTGW